jgi:hypothetical protein
MSGHATPKPTPQVAYAFTVYRLGAAVSGESSLNIELGELDGDADMLQLLGLVCGTVMQEALRVTRQIREQVEQRNPKAAQEFNEIVARVIKRGADCETTIEVRDRAQEQRRRR